MILPSEVENVITEFLPVLKKMQNSKSKNLIDGIIEMQRFGVQSFAERIIYKDGYSALFCTSTSWAKIKKDEEVINEFKNHLSPELVKIYKSKDSLLTRAGDKTSTPFLKILSEIGMNNSVIVHEFDENKVRITYFTGKPEEPEARDKIVSNLESLNIIRQYFKPALQELFLSNEFKEQKELILDHAARSIIWDKSRLDLNDKTNIVSYPLKYLNLTMKEIQCLSFLRFGSSNKLIADNLKISVSQVKNYLSSLKIKLLADSREHLIEIAKDRSIVEISKFIGKV